MFSRKRSHEMSTTQVIAVGFLIAVIIGTLLLLLPFASADGRSVPFVTALFTATTSVCVTGLTVVTTATGWSLFGHIVILLLVQLGGLGVVTFSTSILLLLNKRVTLRDRLLLEDAFNLNTLSGLVAFLKKVLLWTFSAELIGAVCYLPIMLPRYGARGIWYSVFTSVSAFCNAGLDILGENSLNDYVGHFGMNLVTTLLIIAGGIGFIVWDDIGRVIRLIKDRQAKAGQFFKRLNLHSKLTLSVTGILLLGGAMLILAFEYTNPLTIGEFSFGGKVMASFFQSVTSRTAGFTTISQSGLRDPSVILSIILFFIGGSSVGTAGGVKTTSVALVVLFAVSTARASRETHVFRRTISSELLHKALAVVTISFATLVAAVMALSAVTGGELTDVAYEAASAVGTVGLTRDFTTEMNTAGRLIIVLCMYLGRIGPISMAVAFGRKRGARGLVSYPNEQVTVG